MPYTQENRFISIDTPLGKDALLLAGFQGAESISKPFHFELKLLSENHNIVFEDIVGKKATVAVTLSGGERRYFNGLISRFIQQRGGGESGPDAYFSYYSATLVPWFWLLTSTTDARIFQQLSVPDIVEKIFSEKNLMDYKISLNGSYEKRDYCVQYRETDFNFISRLLEDEGIYYFFEHENGKHTMVLADSADSHQPCPYQEDALFHHSAGGWMDDDVITAMIKCQEIRPGKYTLNDYNFKTPTTDLKVEVTSQQALGPLELEIYDYPGMYLKRDGGERLTNLRMQEEETRITTMTGDSVCRAFTTGYKFNLKGHYRSDMADKAFVLTGIEHEASEEQSYLSGSDQSTVSEFSYANHFNCIPLDIPFRPQRATPKPEIRGTQTAIVTGPSGEEIYTDEHGRVKVQFHWDREGQRDDKSSCWIRVSQAWAGGGWGAMQIPRIGQEVIVDFLEGDPDRPVIIGRVYHGNNQPPYSLPDEKTKSTIKSDTTKGGGGFNELRFEDKKGEEEIYLHGQKDWSIAIENDKNQTVGHDETHSVGNNRDKTVAVNQSETIGSNKTISVGANHTETISIAKLLTIGAAYQITVGAAMNETIGAAKAEEIGAAKIVAVGASSSENVGVNKSVNAAKDISENAGNDFSAESGKKMSFKAGDDYSVKGDKNGVIDIKDQLTIKVGKASITMKKNGDITVNGKTINVKGSGNIVMKAKKILEN